MALSKVVVTVSSPAQLIFFLSGNVSVLSKGFPKYPKKNTKCCLPSKRLPGESCHGRHSAKSMPSVIGLLLSASGTRIR